VISLIISLGTVAVLITSLIKDISSSMRRLIGWTFAALTTVGSAVVYFCVGGRFRFQLQPIIAGLCGAAVVLLMAFALEALSPSKRLRSGDKTDYNSEKAEDALNVIVAVIAASVTLAAGACERFGAEPYSILGIVPATAIALRQMSYFMYRVKLDTTRPDDITIKRSRLIKRISSGGRKL